MRWGTAKLAALGVNHDTNTPVHAPPPPCLEPVGPIQSAIIHDTQRLAFHPTAELQPDGTSLSGISEEITVAEVEKEKETPAPTPPLSITNSRIREHDHHHQHGHSQSHDLEASSTTSVSTPAMAATQLVGIAILEFGVLLHSFLIGLTLAVTENFKILFIVLAFHRTYF
jgi:solute carrier family 39 (zinc transporter), member 1/2/3